MTPHPSSPPFRRFAKGFIQGSLLGLVMIVLDLIGWLIVIISGFELPSFSIGAFASICLLSFGLGGSAFHLLWKVRAKRYESLIAYGLALSVFLLVFGIMDHFLESERPFEWLGIGSFILFCLLFGSSLMVIRKAAGSTAPQNGSSAAPLDNTNATAGIIDQLNIRPVIDALKNWTYRDFVIVFLFVALFTSVGFLLNSMVQNHLWKWEVDSLAKYRGRTRAMKDYRNGQIRLFVIAGEHDRDKFSGTNDGPFEIWFPQYYTNRFPGIDPSRYSTEQQVETYNQEMRYMQEHPQKFLTGTNQTEQ